MDCLFLIFHSKPKNLNELIRIKFGLKLLTRVESIKVVDSCWISSTEWSDTFRSFFVYGKERES